MKLASPATPKKALMKAKRNSKRFFRPCTFINVKELRIPPYTFIWPDTITIRVRPLNGLEL